MRSLLTLQLIIALVALVSWANIGVGPVWCVTIEQSPKITVSLTGPLTRVRARHPGEHGPPTGPDQLAVRTTGLRELIEGQKFTNVLSVKSNTSAAQSGPEIPLAKPGLVSGLTRQASRVGSFFKDKIQSSFSSSQESCSRQAGDIKKLLETNYLSVMIRFSKWYSQYKKLYDANQDFLTSPMQLIKQEYAKVDKEIYSNEVERTQLLASLPDDQKVDLKQVESMDFLFKVLQSVIDKLEQDLDHYKSQAASRKQTATHGHTQSTSGGVNNDQEYHDSQQEIEDDDSDFEDALQLQDPHEALLDELEEKKQLERAFDRMKRIVGRAAASLVINEIGLIAQIALLDSLATYVVTQPDNPLMFLTPIIGLIGSVNTPLLTSYMRSMKLRATFKVIGYCNPVPGTLNKVLKVKEN